jgi:hypothetical protein
VTAAAAALPYGWACNNTNTRQQQRGKHSFIQVCILGGTPFIAQRLFNHCLCLLLLLLLCCKRPRSLPAAQFSCCTT